MGNRSAILWVPIFCTFVALLSADEPPNDSSRVVGSVYGKTITAKDIGLTTPIDTAVEFDSSDDARWDQMARIQTVFSGPVLERFIKQQKIEATAGEIEKFNATLRKLSEAEARKA